MTHPSPRSTRFAEEIRAHGWSPWKRLSTTIGIGSIVIGLVLPCARAQLAITEAMSSGSLSDGQTPLHYSDYWELTNFGGEEIDLTPYAFTDLTGSAGADQSLMKGLRIKPQESIVFVRISPGLVETPAQFKAWWGEARLPKALQIVMFVNPGFSNTRDAVRLWKFETTGPRLIHDVDIYESTDGVSFTYDPIRGRADQLSEPGQPGVFQAEHGGDIGSPGYTQGSVPLRVIEQPQSVDTCTGLPTELRVRAFGIPPPTYQWFHDNKAIPEARGSEWIIAHAGPNDSGLYRVEIDNGLERIVSKSATLSLQNQIQAPTLEKGPEDIELTVGQDARFSVRACANPPATYQWHWNGSPLPGTTDPELVLTGVDEFRSGTYSVTVSNRLGMIVAQAELRVVRKPLLRVTEVMAEHSITGITKNHHDWWELTNFDTNSVNLSRYQFDDLPSVVTDSFRIPEGVWIRPGESIILTEETSRAEFFSWWGAHQLPPDLQVIPYAGNGFQAFKDAVTLWGRYATTNNDIVCSVNFFLAPVGRTLWFDPMVAEYGEPTVEGERGAFRSAESDDIGSPGWIDDHEPVLFLQTQLDGKTLKFTWQTVVGANYSVWATENLSKGPWKPIFSALATEKSLTTTDPIDSHSHSLKFYKLVKSQP